MILAAVSLNAQGPGRFSVVEATIPQMQAAKATGQVTSRQLVEQYLTRMAIYEERINAVLAVNPKALEEADQLDGERAQGKLRGALLFKDYVPPYKATLTTNLKSAGAIIIAKTGLTELANWVAGNPNAMPGNYNAVGGFAYNPYDPRPDPRPDPGDGRPVLQTGGSSSGVGTAANFWAGNVGSDTGGSIISPSNANMLVIQGKAIRRVSFVPVTRDANNDVYLLDPSEGEGAKLVQWVKERSAAPPPMRIDGHEVVMFEKTTGTTNLVRQAP